MSDRQLSPQEQWDELSRMHRDADRLAEQRRVEIGQLRREIEGLKERLTAAMGEAYEALDACRKANDEVGQRNARIESFEAALRRSVPPAELLTGLRGAFEKCAALFAEILGDWTDPRDECREGRRVAMAALEQIDAAIGRTP